MTSRRALVAAAIAAVLAVAWWLHRRVFPERSTTLLVLRVTHRGEPVGARVLLIDGADRPLHMGNLDLFGTRQGASACRIAPGVVGSWDGLILGNGLGEVPVGVDACDPSPAIPYGRYRVVAWRGIELERWEGEVDLSEDRGRVELAIELERAWTPHGTLAADLHVHAQASSDSAVPNPQRVIAQAAAGIQVIGLSDHNRHGDLAVEIAELGLEERIVSIASNELTSEYLHLGVYPVAYLPGRPRGGGPFAFQLIPATPELLFSFARALPGRGGIRPIVQVNHPRFRVTALFDVTGWNGQAWPPPFPLEFDAVEVLAGYTAFNVPGDRRFDEGARDYFTLVDHGHPVAPLGNSDTHDLNWVLDGTTRTYVFVDDPRTHPFDEAGFIAALRGARVVATSGPWLDLEVAAREGATPTVGPGQHLRASGSAWVDVTLHQARFVRTERIRIVVGGPHGATLARVIDVPRGVRTHRWRGAVALGEVDTWISVVADGDTPLPLEQTGTYQRDRWRRPGVTPFAITGAILVDVDGDGRWRRGDADYLVTPRGRSSQNRPLPPIRPPMSAAAASSPQ